MAFEEFQTKPNIYYYEERSWKNLTGTDTQELENLYPINEEAIEFIIQKYFELHPEDAFGKYEIQDKIANKDVEESKEKMTE